MGHMSRETYKSYAGVASRRRRCLASLAILWVSRRQANRNECFPRVGHPTKRFYRKLMEINKTRKKCSNFEWKKHAFLQTTTSKLNFSCLQASSCDGPLYLRNRLIYAGDPYKQVPQPQASGGWPGNQGNHVKTANFDDWNLGGVTFEPCSGYTQFHGTKFCAYNWSYRSRPEGVIVEILRFWILV